MRSYAWNVMPERLLMQELATRFFCARLREDDDDVMTKSRNWNLCMTAMDEQRAITQTSPLELFDCQHPTLFGVTQQHRRSPN
jgi:hypothetical protein